MNNINKTELDWLTLEAIEGSEEKLLLYKENDEIVGFYTYELNNQILSILIYVYRKYHKQNIENKIYQEIINQTKLLKYNTITTEFLDNENTTYFFNKEGFKTDYICVKMIYKLDGLNNDLKDKTKDIDTSIVEKYQDSYFDEVNKVASDAFYPLNKANNLKPYRSLWNNDYRKWLNNDDLDCFIIKENNEIVGYSCIKNNEIDKILVNPKHQNKGYGKLLTIHAINFIINKGHDYIYLYRLINNPVADKLYQSLGFVSIGDIVVMKKDL